MIPSKEIFIHDAELEIIVPYDILDCNEEKIDDIFNAPQRNQIFYDESVHFYLVTRLPPESNLENKEEATEFFKNLDITFEATLIDAYLSVPSNYSYSSQLSRRSSSASSTISGIFSSNSSMRSRSSSNSSSPITPGSPASAASGYSIKRVSTGKFTEGTVIFSAQYNSKNRKNNKMVVVERDNCWVSVLPLSFPAAYVRTRAQAQIALNISVVQSQRTQRKMKSPDLDLYSMEHFGVNLLGGLCDDPAFESLNTSCKIPTSRLTKQDLVKKPSIYSSLPSTSIKRCSRKILSVKPTLNVRIRNTKLSPSEDTLMSVDLENDTENNITFSVESVKVDIDHAFVKRYGWGQDASDDKYPILLQPVDQMTLLYNVTMLEDTSYPIPVNAQQPCPTPNPNSRVSSRRESIASISSTISSTINELPVENKYRPFSIIVKACPIIDGVKLRCIESKWNCMLDAPTSINDSMPLPQLEREESKHAQMICDKLNYNNGIGGTNTSSSSDSFSLNNKTSSSDSFSLNNKTSSSDSFSLNSTSSSSDSFSLNNGLGINVTDVDVPNKKYTPSINLSDVDDGDNGILPQGRLPKIQEQMYSDSDDSDGVSVSFTVCGKPAVGKVFTVKVFMVNRSNRARRFTIMIPNEKKPNEGLLQSQLPHNMLLSQMTQTTDITLIELNNNNKKFVRPLEDPFMDETELLRKHLKLETPNANLICLDNNVRIGPIDPNKSESATLHFISTKEASQVVDFIQLVDEDTGFMTNFRDVVQVFVEPWNARNERRIDHNSFVARHIEVAS